VADGPPRPDFKTIANFRKENGKAIGKVCRQFVVLCQQLDLFSDGVVAINGSKFKAFNSSGRNFTDAKLKRRMAAFEANIGRYLAELDTADQQEPVSAKSKSARLNEQAPDAMRIRRSTVEHPYATIKSWMGSTHFLTKGLERVKAEMSLHVLAYNFRRLMSLLGMQGMLAGNQGVWPFSDPTRPA
jgi:transposase